MNESATSASVDIQLLIAPFAILQSNINVTLSVMSEHETQFLRCKGVCVSGRGQQIGFGGIHSIAVSLCLISSELQEFDNL